jgi:hypothetical protein
MIDATARYRDLAYIESLKPDYSPLPLLPETSPGVRCFLVFPYDDPLPEGALQIIEQRYHSVVNWVEAASGYRLLAHPDVIGLQLTAPARTIATWGVREARWRALMELQAHTPFKPLSRTHGSAQEAWLLLLRGNATIVPCASPKEYLAPNLGVALLNDPAISAWLSAGGLEPNRIDPTPGYPAFYSANEASGILAHELLHTLGASHHETGVMGPLQYSWPNAHIDSIAEKSTMMVLRESPLVLKTH